MRDGMAKPLTPSGIDAALDQQRAMARRYGAPEDVAAEVFRRNLTTRDGHIWARPLPHVLATLQKAMADLDIIPVYRQVKCPLLVALATDDIPEQQPFHELYAAYRRGFEGRLAKAVDANPCLRVVRVEGATHAMVAERPGEIAQLITHFATFKTRPDQVATALFMEGQEVHSDVACGFAADGRGLAEDVGGINGRWPGCWPCTTPASVRLSIMLSTFSLLTLE
jgi:hypothetical protein